MIFSISPRWSALNDCARAGAAAGSASRTANSAAARGREARFMVFVLLSSMAPRALRRLVAGEVVGFHPTGRADRETGLGPRSNLARGLHVAAHEGRLRGCEVRARQVVLLAIGHGQLAVGIGRFRLAV